MAVNIIMTIFWVCEDVLLVDFLPCGTTVNGSYYKSLLHQLHCSIREKGRRKVRHGVLFLHDNAPVHKSNITQTAIQLRGFTELNHRAYSPDLAPSDCHLFLNMNFLRSRNFESDNDREPLFRES